MGDLSGNLIVYPDGTDKPGVEFWCANGFVSRVVSAVAEQNIPDAERVCKILNGTDSEITSAKARLTARSMDMLQLRNMLIDVRDKLEDEDDRVFFGSTNDADDFRQAVEILDGWHWSVIMEEAKGEDLLGQIRTLCTTLSRQAELLGRAAKALKPFADGLQFYRDDSIDNETFLDWSENIKVGDLRTASSTLDAIRDELGGEQG